MNMLICTGANSSDVKENATSPSNSVKALRPDPFWFTSLNTMRPLARQPCRIGAWAKFANVFGPLTIGE